MKIWPSNLAYGTFSKGENYENNIDFAFRICGIFKTKWFFFSRKIFAFDKSPERLKTLKRMVATAGASCVTPTCCDFLRVDPQDSRYRNVEYILVDPSCSGSGKKMLCLQTVKISLTLTWFRLWWTHTYITKSNFI